MPHRVELGITGSKEALSSNSPIIPPKNPARGKTSPFVGQREMIKEAPKIPGRDLGDEEEEGEEEEEEEEEMMIPLLPVPSVIYDHFPGTNVMGRITHNTPPSLCTSLSPSTFADFHYQIAPFVDYSPTEGHFDWEEWERMRIEEAKELAWVVEEMERRKGLEECRIDQFRRFCEDMGKLGIGEKVK